MYNKTEFIEICHQVYEKEFVAAYSGNLSVRLDDERILITPSAKCKGELVEDDLLEIDYEGNLLSGIGKVSTEAKIHLLAYTHRKEVNSVVHCHPIYATGLATAGEGLTNPVFPEVVLGLGKVPLCKYATPSTDELPNSMLPYIDFAWAMLLQNHGAVTFGDDLKGAYYRMEVLEHSAKTLFAARTFGRERIIPNLKLKKLYEISEQAYGIEIDDRLKMNF